jgi:hypothetical protein
MTDDYLLSILRGEPGDKSTLIVSRGFAHAAADRIEGLLTALKWALCHAEEREGDADFHAEYAKAYAALRCAEGEGRVEP